jgi:hypothetical protein
MSDESFTERLAEVTAGDTDGAMDPQSAIMKILLGEKSGFILHFLQGYYDLGVDGLSTIAENIEGTPTEDLNQSLVATHHSLVAAALIISVSRVEGTVNSYIEIVKQADRYQIRGVEDEQRVLNNLEDYIDFNVGQAGGLPILKKAQALLALLGKEEFDEGAEPFQPMRAIIRTRNALVHPTLLEHDINEELDLWDEEPLKWLKPYSSDFEENPLMYRDPEVDLIEEAERAAFPMEIFSASFSQWVQSITTEFLQQLSNRLDLHTEMEEPEDKVSEMDSRN